MASPHAQVAEIVSRISLDDAVGEMAAEFRSQIEAFGRLSSTSQDDVAVGVQRNLRRWWRWLETGEVPPDSDFDPLRDWARDRAAEGVGLDDLLRAFGIASQLGWQLIRRSARSDESDALLDAAGLLMQYLDRVSSVVTETYLAEREVLASEEERRIRTLLERLASGRSLDAAHADLLERLGVPLADAYAPFAVALPGRPPRRHAALAARLRRRGWTLTVTEGDRVVGLTWRRIDTADLDEGADAVLVSAQPTPRVELAQARDEVRLVLEHARRSGLRGLVRAEDHLLEVLLARSPRTGAQLRAAVAAPLDAELVRTLQALVECRLDRAAASRALHVHRNTLGYRLRKIEEITGLDLDDPRDIASVYLALVVQVNNASG